MRVWMLLLLSGCAGYASFSNHQTARMLEPGRQSFTGAVGATQTEIIGDDPLSANGVAVEAMYRRGVSPRVEAGAKLSHLRWDGEYADDNTLVYLDAKLSLLPDELAVVLPVGIGFGSDGGNGVHHLQTQPGLVYSATFSPHVGMDASLRMIVSTSDRLNSFGVLSGAATVGVRLRSDSWRFELHPEIGVLADDLTRKYTKEGQSLTFGVSLGGTYWP